jgi:centromere protein C
MEFFTNTRIPLPGSSLNRLASSSRVPTRPAGVDFDKVPSPRPRTSLAASKRHSMANGTAPGPSNLSKSSVAPEANSSPDRGQEDQSGMDASFADYGHPDTPPENSSPQHTSFLQMDQDDDGDEVNAEEQMLETPVQTSKVRKGKERATEQEGDLQEDNDVEMEIAQGLEDVDLADQSDEEASPPKKAKTVNNKPKVSRRRKQTERSRMFHITLLYQRIYLTKSSHT